MSYFPSRNPFATLVKIINNYWTRLSKISWFVSGEQINFYLFSIFDLRDTNRSRYFAKTEFNNSFITRSPNLICTISFGNWEPRASLLRNTEENNNFACDDTNWSSSNSLFLRCDLKYIGRFLLPSLYSRCFCGSCWQIKPLSQNSTGKRAAIFLRIVHNHAWAECYLQQNHCRTVMPDGNDPMVMTQWYSG